MTVIDVSIAELQALLDGGDDEDWVVLCKVRLLADRTAVVRVMDIHGEHGPDAWVRPGDTVSVNYTLNLVP